MKIVLALIVFAFVFVPVTEAKTISIVKTSTTGKASVSVRQNIASSSSNLVVKNCSFSKVISTNGGGKVEVKGSLDCCK